MTTDEAKKLERTARIENIIATLFAILGVGTLFGLTYLSLPAFGGISDLPEYYAPAKLIFEGKGALGYTLDGLAEAQHRFFPSMGGRIVALFVPPQGLALVSPIALLSPDASRFVWKTLLVLCLAASVFLLKKTFNLGYKQTCYLIAAISLSDAAYNSLRIDQLAPILLLAYVAAIYCFKNNNNIGAGMWLALVILKPQQFLPFMAYLAGTRKIKPLIVCAGIVAALSVVAWLQIGQTGWTNYFALVSAPSSVPFMQPELTPTLRGQLLRLFPSASSSIFSLTSGLYLFSIALSAFAGWKLREKRDSVLLGVLGVMPLGLVLSMHCHTYDLLLLIPTILLIFNDAVMPFNQIWKLAVMLGAIVFVLPLSVEIQHDYLLKGGQFNPWFFLLLPLSVALLAQVLKKNPNVQPKESN
ncbi:MAG: hypothetical protein C0507_07120 [Cyanobacteria bacterium PR.3.49]|nr:hypothetical protein [Cyanobacteria bacterium PR.3.49]